MKQLLFAFLIVSFPASYAAMKYTGSFSNLYVKESIAKVSSGSILSLYLTDYDLNTSPKGIDVVDTAGLLEFTLNGITI